MDDESPRMSRPHWRSQTLPGAIAGVALFVAYVVHAAAVTSVADPTMGPCAAVHAAIHRPITLLPSVLVAHAGARDAVD